MHLSLHSTVYGKFLITTKPRNERDITQATELKREVTDDRRNDKMNVTDSIWNYLMQQHFSLFLVKKYKNILHDLDN